MAKDTEYKEFAKKFPAPRVIPDNLSSELLDRLRKGWIALAVENEKYKELETIALEFGDDISGSEEYKVTPEHLMIPVFSYRLEDPDYGDIEVRLFITKDPKYGPVNGFWGYRDRFRLKVWAREKLVVDLEYMKAYNDNVQVDGEWVGNYEAEAEPTYKTERGSLPAKYIPGKWEAVLFGAVRDDLKELKGKRASIAESKKRNELRRLLHFREDL